MRFFVFSLLTLAGLSLSAQDTPPTMTKIVVRLSGPRIKSSSYAALPKTMYVAAPHFARIEDAPDARQGVQKLVIIAEPDAYSANLIDHKGTHAIDQGGPGDLHLPVMLPFDPKHEFGVMDKLEFGSELPFFEAAGAKKRAGPIVNSKPTDEYRIALAHVTASLIVTGDAEQKPVKLMWKDDEGTHVYEYNAYEELKFDPELFSKPAGIQFREMRPDTDPSDQG